MTMFGREKRPPAPEVDNEALDAAIEAVDLDDSITEDDKLGVKFSLISDAYEPVIEYHRAEGEHWGRKADGWAKVNVFLYAGLGLLYFVLAIAKIFSGSWGFVAFYLVIAAAWGGLAYWWKTKIVDKS
jgi:hypothetical protein